MDRSSSPAFQRGWTPDHGAVDSACCHYARRYRPAEHDPAFIHLWRVYGFWSPAVKDYVEMKVMDWNGTPQFRNDATW